MPNIKLRVYFPAKNYGDTGTQKLIQFDDEWLVKRAIEECFSKDNQAKAGLGGQKASDFGLYQMSSIVNSNSADAVGKSGHWLDPKHELKYYFLRDNDEVEFRFRMRKLKIKLLDNSVKSVMVDESLTIDELMPLICEKIGVTNAEEYSLVRYTSDEVDGLQNGTLTQNGTLRNGTGTLRGTLRKQKDQQKLDPKMEQLKRKLKTEEDLDWVDHSKTLEGQDIGEEEILTFRRKFFYSDQNIDSRDPMQLHLLYVQTSNAVLKGTHPVTFDQACRFAGLQRQIEHSDFTEGNKIHDLKLLVPRDYAKEKNVEKKIAIEHSKHMGMSATDAKVQYVQMARGLKTYGVTFFLVKEKMQGKNKLVPRLLGVTKDSVLRLDERTKEILKTWPLTTVKRWAPTPNSFTLDFGDYSDQYYSVQTSEGEQIAKLIAGYIDIILRRKKAKDHLGIDGDEASAMLEDSISPSKATIMQHKPDPKPCKPIIEDVAIPGIIRTGAGNEAKIVKQVTQEKQMPIVQNQAPTYTQAPVMPAQHPKYLRTGMSEPKHALLSTIGFGQDAVERAQNELSGSGRPPSRSDSRSRADELDVKRETVASQVAALNAATAQVLSLTSVPEEEVDHPALGAAINTITANLPEMSRDVKTIANLMDDHDRADRLMNAARSLCSAFSDLLKAAEPGSGVPRQNVINAANKVSDASTNLLYTIEEGEDIDREASEKLLSLAKNVANATATLVRKAKAVASQCDDQAAKNRVISAATQCALATSQLVSCAKVVAPTIHSQNCQKQVIDSAREVSKAVDGIVSVCKDSLDDSRLNNEVEHAATDVNYAIEQLLSHVRSLSDGKKRQRDDGAVDTILDATDRLFSSSGDVSEMVKQAKILAQATSQLIQNIKGQAEGQSDSDIQKRLLGAAKTLADATTRLVEAAKGCASNPHDSTSQAALCQAAQELRSATSSASSNVLKRKIMARLEGSAKHAAAMGSQSISSAQGATQSNINGRVQQELHRVCQMTGAQIPQLVSAIRGSQADPNNSSKQSQLISACESFIEPANSLASVSRSAVPTIQDKSVQLQMNESTQNLSEALVDLREAIAKAIEACSFSMQIEAAIQQLREQIQNLDDTRREIIRGGIRPIPDESVDSWAHQLNNASKSVVASIAQLLICTSQGEETYISTATRDATERLKNLASAAKGVAINCQERDVQMKMLDGANEIMQQTTVLFEEIRWAMENQQDAERHARLTSVAKALSNSLQIIVNSLPSHKEIDDSIQEVIDGVRHISVGSASGSGRSYADLQNAITQAAQRLSESTSDVISGTRSSSQLGGASKNFTQNFTNLSKLANELAGQSIDLHARSAILDSIQNCSTCSANFLHSAKNVAQNPNSGSGPSQLAATARSVTESVSNLLNACSLSAPGQKECDQAIADIQMMRSMLDQPYLMSQSGYFECLELVTERSRHLGDAMTGIANYARKSEHERFGSSVKEASESICGLLEGAVQAAYLIGASDPSSVAGRPAVVDIVMMQRCADQLHNSGDILLSPNASKDQLILAVTDIANSTHSLINACKNAPSKHFVQSAKSLTMSTAELVREIRTINNQNVDQVRNSCRNFARPLLDGVDQLMSIASSPEFASIPAKIPAKARHAQQPIIDYGKTIIDSSCSMIGAAKGLALDPKDPPGWQTLANHSKSVSDSIKRLVTAIKDAAPGQNECDEALEKIRHGMNELDQAGLNAINRMLSICEDNNLKGFREIMSQSAYQIDDTVDRVCSAGKSHAEKLGHSVSSMSQYFEPLVQASIGYASKIPDPAQQKKIIDSASRICEHSLSFIYPVKECGGNPKASALHAEIEDGAQNVHSAVRELQNMLELAASADGHVSGVVDIITKSISRLDERFQNGYINGSMPDSLSYVDYQTRMVANTKEVARIAKDMVVKSSSQVSQLGVLANKLAHTYSSLAGDVNGISAATNNLEIVSRIKSTVQDLGAACIDLTKCSGEVQVQPDSSYALRELNDASRMVSERAGSVLAALQSGSRGTQACIDAANNVQSIISDIDTTIMFAHSGTLNADNVNDTFAIHKDDILKTAKSLVEDTKTLVAGAASSQEALAQAAQNAVSTITQLADAVKAGAATLGSQNSEAQVMLLNSVKDVALALSDLIESTKSASGKNINDPAMTQLKDSAKIMVTNVTSLLKTVKTVEDEQARGTRALESTIEGIDTEIRSYFSGSMYMSKDVTPEEMIRSTKPVTLATSKAVAAGISGKQDDVIVVANMARKAIHDLLQVCRSASNLADNDELRSRILDAGKNAAQNYQELLKFIFHNLQQPMPIVDVKQQLTQMSRIIAQSVTEIVALAEMLKSVDWVDPDDPTVIAENELLGAASSIEAAALKLAKLQPRQSGVKINADDMNFDEMILEAAKSITQATAMLIRAASSAQKELVATGKADLNSSTYSDDDQWSEGLIGAARTVAAATHSLVEAANALVQGQASEEKLISAAKQVASCTAQLLVACKVKADPESQAMRRLQTAGNAVKKATDNLVRAAQQAIEQEEEQSLVISKRRVAGMTQEIIAREEMLRKEKELIEARAKLAAINKARYGNKNGPQDQDYGFGPSNGQAQYNTQSYSYEYHTHSSSQN